jgi:hypothetical protein
MTANRIREGWIQPTYSCWGDKIKIRKCTGKRYQPFVKQRRRWKNNIRINLNESGCGSLDGYQTVKNREQ